MCICVAIFSFFLKKINTRKDVCDKQQTNYVIYRHLCRFLLLMELIFLVQPPCLTEKKRINGNFLYKAEEMQYV